MLPIEKSQIKNYIENYVGNYVGKNVGKETRNYSIGKKCIIGCFLTFA